MLSADSKRPIPRGWILRPTPTTPTSREPANTTPGLFSQQQGLPSAYEECGISSATSNISLGDSMPVYPPKGQVATLRESPRVVAKSWQ